MEDRTDPLRGPAMNQVPIRDLQHRGVILEHQAMVRARRQGADVHPLKMQIGQLPIPIARRMRQVRQQQRLVPAQLVPTRRGVNPVTAPGHRQTQPVRIRTAHARERTSPMGGVRAQPLRTPLPQTVPALQPRPIPLQKTGRTDRANPIVPAQSRGKHRRRGKATDVRKGPRELFHGATRTQRIPEIPRTRRQRRNATGRPPPATGPARQIALGQQETAQEPPIA